jgi:two-component system LytT family sensor kinase
MQNRLIGWKSVLVASILLRNVYTVILTCGYKGTIVLETSIEGYLTMFITIGILYEVLRGISLKMDQRLSWAANPEKRFGVQLAIEIPATILCISGPGSLIAIALEKNTAFLSGNIELLVRELVLLNIIGLGVTFVMISLEMGIFFLHQWRHSCVELERFQQEHAEFRFQALKNQINPHFLFNSLNTLSSLIYVDQDDAAKFVRQLAKVYRYVLENREKEVIRLETELTILESYIYLAETRFRDKLVVDIHIDDGVKQRGIPPMTLQMLIENAIKHNITSQARPLHINIFSENDEYLVIQNSLQRISSIAYSSRIGLKNVITRYKYCTPRDIIIEEGKGLFTVKLPLLEDVEPA